MTSWARLENEPKKEDPKWEHVDIHEEKDQFAELADRIDKAYKKYADRELDFSNFGNSYSDEKAAKFLYAYSGMQKCMGNVSESALDIFKGGCVNLYSYSVKRPIGRMLFYMQVMLDCFDGDLTDAKDECARICEGVARL